MSRYQLICGIAVLCTFYLVFFSQQHWGIYSRTLGLVYPTYDKSDDGFFLGKYVYKPINAETMTHWDASHYDYLHKNFYEAPEGRRFLFAFFPFFPMLWKALQIPVEFIGIFNFLLFFAGLVFLWKVLPKEWPASLKNILFPVALTFSSVTIVHMPYAEASSFFLFSVAIYGLVKKKRWLFILFAFLFATSRPNILMLILSWGAAEAWLVLMRRKIEGGTFWRPLPFLFGLISVFALYYFVCGEWNAFFQAQSGWKTQLQVPKAFSDWATESFPVNILFLSGWVPFLSFMLTYRSIQALRGRKYLFHADRTYDLLITVGHVFSIATGLFILLYQGGNVHSAHRYLSVTPLFFLTVGYYMHTGTHAARLVKWLVPVLLTLITLLSIFWLDPHKFHFAKATGLYLALLAIPLIFLHRHFIRHKIFTVFAFLYFLVCICWQTLLFNQFLADAWIWV